MSAVRGCSQTASICRAVLSVKDMSTIPSLDLLFPCLYHLNQVTELLCVLQYYEDEGDSEASGAHPDEEVAVTKRGRAVKLPAKYKAEVSVAVCSRLLHTTHLRQKTQPSSKPPLASCFQLSTLRATDETEVEVLRNQPAQHTTCCGFDILVHSPAAMADADQPVFEPLCPH